MAADVMGQIMLRSADQFLFDVIVKRFSSSAKTDISFVSYHRNIA